MVCGWLFIEDELAGYEWDGMRLAIGKRRMLLGGFSGIIWRSAWYMDSYSTNRNGGGHRDCESSLFSGRNGSMDMGKRLWICVLVLRFGSGVCRYE